MGSSISTGAGDGGESTSLAGDRVPKDHIIMECVGTLDELGAHTALLRCQLKESSPDDKEEVQAFLKWLLNVYSLIGTACSDPENRHPELRRASLTGDHVSKIEREESALEKKIALAGVFVAGASTVPAAQADVSRTVARRLERSLAKLRREYPSFEAEPIGVFINRLSDYFFLLARFLEGEHHEQVDWGVAGDVS